MRTFRKKNSGLVSPAANRKIIEPTITQNGALYHVQHKQPTLPPARILSRLSFKDSKSRETSEQPLAPRVALGEPVESGSTN